MTTPTHPLNASRWLETPSSSRRTVWLLAACAGLAVANLYYAQPLAATMAVSLRVTPQALGATLMLSQLGYALGMLLLVPLGDGRERRGLMVATASASAAALLAFAAAPSFTALAVTSFLLGFTSSLPQMIVPFVAALVPAAERGRAIGEVMSGLLAGILLSRTVSGTVATVVGWRPMFVCAAGIMALVAAVLRTALPTQEPAEPLRWGRILASLARLLRKEPLLRTHAAVGALGFAAFSAFWSTLSFHLAKIGYGSSIAGMFGAIGLVGVAVAPITGRLAERVAARGINAVGLTTVALGFALFALSSRSLIVLGAGVVLLDGGVQASHLANQTVLLGLEPELRNRLNAVYMVSYFVGGALGTTLATAAWTKGGWPAVCVVGATLAIAGTIPLLRSRARDS